MLNIKPSEEYVKLARRCDLLPSDRAIRKVWGCARNPQLSWIREEMTAKGWAFEYPPTGWIKVTARPPAEEQEPWQEKKSGYYNIEADGSIPASLVAEKTYYAQIATSDDGKITIGTIHESQFKPEAAQAICDKAVALGKDWDWWQANYREWWRTNWMVNREP